jgi:hypothetical protein
MNTKLFFRILTVFLRTYNEHWAMKSNYHRDEDLGYETEAIDIAPVSSIQHADQV